jgi:hypothetical protein
MPIVTTMIATRHCGPTTTGLRSAILVILDSVLATTVFSGALGTDRPIAEPLATVRAERPTSRVFETTTTSSWLGPDNTSTRRSEIR